MAYRGASHDPVESFETGAGLSFLGKPRRLQSGNLLRHRHRYELIYARSFLFAQPLDRFLQRSRQAQSIGFGFRRGLIHAE